MTANQLIDEARRHVAVGHNLRILTESRRHILLIKQLLERQTPLEQLARETEMRILRIAAPEPDVVASIVASPPPPSAVIHEQHHSVEYWRLKWGCHRQTVVRLAHQESEGILWTGTVRRTPTISDSAAGRMYARYQPQTGVKTRKPSH